MLTIKVVGSDSINTSRLEKVTQEAVEYLGAEVEILKISNQNEIVEHGILTTPGLIVNDKIVSSGRVPSLGEVTSWIATALDVARHDISD
jgi:small redox-active disulfide protein 2